MWQLGSDDWISYGWGPDLRSERYPINSGNNYLTVDFSKYKLPTAKISPIIAAVDAVNDIVANYPGPYTLMCSGGVDSQSMIWCWILSGIPFNIVSIRYISNSECFNDYDLDELRQFAEVNNLEVTYIDFDVINFLENDLQDISKNYDCDSPQFCTHIKMSECVQDGTIMFSGNYIHGQFGLSYTMLGLHRYAIASRTTSRNIIPAFFLHNPSLAFSFTYNNNYCSSYIPKDIFLAAGFPIIPPPEKYNGFEKIKEYYDQYNDRVTSRTRLLYSSQPSRRVFDLLFRYPLHSSNINKLSYVTTILNETQL
jgi:hypothetical protein